MAADMGYMQRPVELLSDPRKLQKSARSVVSFGVSYYPGDHPENTRGGGRVARYAWGRDYHEVIKERLFRLRSELEGDLGVRIKARGFTDAVPLLERSAAQHAGLGFFGRNACLINGGVGSYFFIADLLVDLDLEPDQPGSGTCGRCTRCMDACPTGAIKAPGVVDARLCISYLTIENRARSRATFGRSWATGPSAATSARRSAPTTRRRPPGAAGPSSRVSQARARTWR